MHRWSELSGCFDLVSILTYCINQMHDGIERAKDVELLSCKSGAEYLLAKLRLAVTSVKAAQDGWKKQSSGDESMWKDRCS